MSTTEQENGRTRWEILQESTFALATKCEHFDPDGITVYVFSNTFQRYDHVTSAKVTQVFADNQPGGTTNLAGVLQHTINNYFQRKVEGKTKKNGEIILVVTDGEPCDRQAVIETIINATHRMEKPEELGISLIQVGCDPNVTKFFTALDDLLQSIGAKFDICDTVALDEIENMSLVDVLMNAITD